MIFLTKCLPVQNMKERTVKDLVFLHGVMNHKAFLYGFTGDFPAAIEIYRLIYGFNSRVSRNILKQIDYSVSRFLESGICSETMAEDILKWKKSLIKDKERPPVKAAF